MLTCGEYATHSLVVLNARIRPTFGGDVVLHRIKAADNGEPLFLARWCVEGHTALIAVYDEPGAAVHSLSRQFWMLYLWLDCSRALKGAHNE